MRRQQQRAVIIIIIVVPWFVLLAVGPMRRIRNYANVDYGNGCRFSVSRVSPFPSQIAPAAPSSPSEIKRNEIKKICCTPFAFRSATVLLGCKNFLSKVCPWNCCLCGVWFYLLVASEPPSQPPPSPPPPHKRQLNLP